MRRAIFAALLSGFLVHFPARNAYDHDLQAKPGPARETLVGAARARGPTLERC